MSGTLRHNLDITIQLRPSHKLYIEFVERGGGRLTSSTLSWWSGGVGAGGGGVTKCL